MSANVNVNAYAPRDATVHRLVAARAAARPAATALLAMDEPPLTYRELDARSTGLAAHCLDPGDGRTAEDLRARCATELPPYMRPRHLELLGAFLLTASGKVDLKALAARHDTDPAAAGPAVEDSLLEAVLSAASGLTGRSCGPDEDLFLPDGDSLLAMQLTSRLGRRHRIRVGLDTVYEGRTPRAIAAGAEPLSELTAVAPRPDDPRLHPVFQAALIYQKSPVAALTLPGHTVHRRDIAPPAASLPFLVQIWPGPDGGWDVWLECDPTRVPGSVLDELSVHLTGLLHTTAVAAG